MMQDLLLQATILENGASAMSSAWKTYIHELLPAGN